VFNRKLNEIFNCQNNANIALQAADEARMIFKYWFIR
jgi:hypothetical protein